MSKKVSFRLFIYVFLVLHWTHFQAFQFGLSIQYVLYSRRQFQQRRGKWIGEGDGTPLQYSCLENSMGEEAWQSMGSQRIRQDWATSLFAFHFHALEKEMATHSSVLAWRISGTGEPGGLPSMGSHRVGHDWSDLAAAAAAAAAACKTQPIFYHYPRLTLQIMWKSL